MSDKAAAILRFVEMTPDGQRVRWEEIERMIAHIAELEAERDALVKEHIRQTDSNLKLIRERDGLKVALIRIRDDYTTSASAIARAALSGEGVTVTPPPDHS